MTCVNRGLFTCDVIFRFRHHWYHWYDLFIVSIVSIVSIISIVSIVSILNKMSVLSVFVWETRHVDCKPGAYILFESTLN